MSLLAIKKKEVEFYKRIKIMNMISGDVGTLNTRHPIKKRLTANAQPF